MKINWGFGIALFYTSFMVILLYFVIKSTTYDKSLVMDNYYEQDINYQVHFDKKKNAQEMTQQVSIKYDIDNKSVELIFPDNSNNIEGSVQFFHPFLESQDMKRAIKLDHTGKMDITTKLLKPGKWKVILDWKDNQKAYYKETDIFL